MNLGAALVAETLINGHALKEQLHYNGIFFFAFLQGCGVVPQSEAQSLQNIPNYITWWLREGSTNCKCKLPWWI